MKSLKISMLLIFVITIQSYAFNCFDTPLFDAMPNGGTKMFNDQICLYGSEQWKFINNHAFILYRSNEALALIKIRGYVYPTSSINLVNECVHRFDKILIDNRICTIISSESLNNP